MGGRYVHLAIPSKDGSLPLLSQLHVELPLIGHGGVAAHRMAVVERRASSVGVVLSGPELIDGLFSVPSELLVLLHLRVDVVARAID